MNDNDIETFSEIQASVFGLLEERSVWKVRFFSLSGFKIDETGVF